MEKFDIKRYYFEGGNLIIEIHNPDNDLLLTDQDKNSGGLPAHPQGHKTLEENWVHSGNKHLRLELKCEGNNTQNPLRVTANWYTSGGDELLDIVIFDADNTRTKIVRRNAILVEDGGGTP